MRLKGDYLSRTKMDMNSIASSIAPSQYITSILWILLLGSFMNSPEKEVKKSEFAYSFKRSPALRVVRQTPTSSQDEHIRAQISALDFKILGYLSTDSACSLSTNDLINIMSGMHGNVDAITVSKRIINSRLYAMLQSNKVVMVKGVCPMWLRLD